MKNHSIKRRRTLGRFWLGVFLMAISASVVLVFQAYPHAFETDVTLEKSSEIKSNEQVVINFSLPMMENSFEEGFSIMPAQKVSFKWGNNNKRVVITPQNSWEPETSYVVQIKKGKNIILKKIDKILNFKTADLPKISSFFPNPGEKNIAVDMENPVRVNFDRSLDGYNVKFVVNPNETLGWQMNDEKTQVSLLAKDDFKWETRYTIGVFIKQKQQSLDNYVKIGETFFETALKPAPEVWDKDPIVRSAQAKKFTEAKIQNGKYIDIDLSEQMMVIFENGIALDGYLISSGKRGMETPVGSYKVENKSPRAWSRGYSLWMPNWMAFLPSGEMGIHELPVWPSGFQEGANHLGTPVSHGCVRLGPVSAKRVFDWAEIGMPVIIHS